MQTGGAWYPKPDLLYGSSSTDLWLCSGMSKLIDDSSMRHSSAARVWRRWLHCTQDVAYIDVYICIRHICSPRHFEQHRKEPPTLLPNKMSQSRSEALRSARANSHLESASNAKVHTVAAVTGVAPFQPLPHCFFI